MDRRALRIGNYVQDIKNGGYVLRVGLAEMRYADNFDPILLSEDFFLKNNFTKTEINNEVNYALCGGSTRVVAHRNGNDWDIDISNGNTARFVGKIHHVHEFQNAMAVCQLFWKIVA